VDTSKSVSEPFRHYHDFHNQLNVTLKVLVAAVEFTVTEVSKPSSKVRLGDLIRSADPSWTSPAIWDAHPALRPALLTSIAHLGITSVYSALDDFRVGTEAEIARWEDISGLQMPFVAAAHEADDGDLPLTRFLERRGWYSKIDNNLLVLLKYFDAVRNCIAHRRGRVSRELKQLSCDSALAAASRNLSRKGINTLPPFKEEDIDLVLYPKHAIIYSHMGRLFAKTVNSLLIEMIGADGVLNLAAFHTASQEYFTKGMPRLPEVALKHALLRRYKVLLEDANEGHRRLRRLGGWQKFAAAYRRLRPTPVES
jgi:hypothetical protein